MLNNNIKDLIYTIRDKQVMLDSDVAFLYGYETKVINQTVKRNIGRFPETFCFRLTNEEYDSLKSQIVTSNIQAKYLSEHNLKSRGGKHKSPYVFTEKGIIMLSGLLKNEIAVSISLKIVEAFVEMRKYILSNNNLFEQVLTIKSTMDTKFLEYDKNFDKIFNQLQCNPEFKQQLFFKGQIFDAYELILNLIKQAKREIVIIDNYIDESILSILKRKKENVIVTIITSNSSILDKKDISKFNEQYPKLSLKYSNKYHDRFIIIDNVIYHCGASLKDLGKKVFAINKIEDKDSLKELLEI